MLSQNVTCVKFFECLDERIYIHCINKCDYIVTVGVSGQPNLINQLSNRITQELLADRSLEDGEPSPMSCTNSSRHFPSTCWRISQSLHNESHLNRSNIFIVHRSERLPALTLVNNRIKTGITGELIRFQKRNTRFSLGRNYEFICTKKSCSTEQKIVVVVLDSVMQRIRLKCVFHNTERTRNMKYKILIIINYYI